MFLTILCRLVKSDAPDLTNPHKTISNRTTLLFAKEIEK